MIIKYNVHRKKKPYSLNTECTHKQINIYIYI